MTVDRLKHTGDIVAYAGGSVGSLAYWSEVAGQLTPIVSVLFVVLSILWLLWRMIDRLRFGPSAKREDSDG